jgi:hypothetical protein
VNAASAVLFPVAVCASEHEFGFFLQFLGVHAAVVFLASIFSFFAVFAVVGVLMVALPYAIFRRTSLYLRGLLVAGLVAVLSTSFAVPPIVNRLPGTLIRFLPPVWFLGLCQMLRGRANQPLATLGRIALLGSGVVVVAAVAIYSLSYRRCFARIPETTDTGSSSIRTRFSWIFPQLDRTILNSPFQRAGYRFVIKTLFRSEQHGLVLGGFFGLGIVIASQFLFAAFNSTGSEPGGLPSSEILAIPLILSYCVILGVRFAFEIPIELRANWIFRLSIDKATQECIPLARKAILSFVLPGMVAIGLPVYWAFWGWRVGLLQTTVVTVWSLLLTEVLLARFRKIPFSCSYPPFRHSAVVSVMSYVLGFFLFVVVTSELEYRALLEPAWMASFPAIALSVWYGLSRFHERIEEIDKELIFEDNAPPAFVTLDLGHRT